MVERISGLSGYVVLVIFVAFSSLSALANTTMVSTNNKNTLYSTISNSVHTNYVAEYHGSSLNDPVGEKQRDKFGKVSDPVTVTQKVPFTIQFSEKFSYSFEPCWEWRPVVKPETWWNDMYTGSSMIELIKLGYVTFSANFSAELPTSAGSREQYMVVAPGTEQSLAIKLGESKFTLGNNTFYRGYIYNRLSPGIRYRLYEGPWVTYDLVSGFGTGLNYNIDIVNRRSEETNKLEDDSVNLKWWFGGEILKKTRMDFYVLTFPRDLFALNATKFGIVLNYAFF